MKTGSILGIDSNFFKVFQSSLRFSASVNETLTMDDSFCLSFVKSTLVLLSFFFAPLPLCVSLAQMFSVLHLPDTVGAKHQNEIVVLWLSGKKLEFFCFR